MAAFIILAVMITALIAIWIWPHIRVERVIHLPDNWEPEPRGTVQQRAGGAYWVAGSGRVAG